MSLLKEGDGVNFQKASCTLDGCVKIYTSRVDSVATETGKLLSGLTESDNKKRRKSDGEGGEGVEGEEDEGEEQEEDGVRRRVKKRVDTQLFGDSFLAMGRLTSVIGATIIRSYPCVVIRATATQKV